MNKTRLLKKLWSNIAETQNTMIFSLRKRSKKHPVRYRRHNQSIRKQAFDMYSQGYRPSDIYNQELLPTSRQTLYRYYEDWKKQEKTIPYGTLRDLMKKNPEFNQRIIGMLAEYLGESKEKTIVRMQTPWGLKVLLKGESTRWKLKEKQNQIEYRLRSAIQLINLLEDIHNSTPEEINDLITQLLSLNDGEKLVVMCSEGHITVEKELLESFSITIEED
jgi:hypothetical protein